MYSRFEELQEVKEVYFINGSRVTVGDNGIDKITVVLEYNNKSIWFAGWSGNKVKWKYNGEMATCVKL
jgi:hypothetical protein